MKKIIAVSACLVGKNTKYNGGNNFNEAVLTYLKGKEFILICPEVMGNLPTPRKPSEIIGNQVYNSNQEDVTKQFIDGSNKALSLLKENRVNEVILKSKSPSCGYKQIYDGSFSNTLIEGNGIFVRMLLNSNIQIYTEKDIEAIIGEKQS